MSVMSPTAQRSVRMVRGAVESRLALLAAAWSQSAALALAQPSCERPPDRVVSVEVRVVRPVRVALLEEGVAPLGGLIRAVREPGRFTGEQLLTDKTVIDHVEGVLEHPLRRR